MKYHLASVSSIVVCHAIGGTVANVLGYASSNCSGPIVWQEGQTCNGCVIIPYNPRMRSYAIVDAEGMMVTSRPRCDGGNMGYWTPYHCLNDPDAIAASMHVDC